VWIIVFETLGGVMLFCGVVAWVGRIDMDAPAYKQRGDAREGQAQVSDAQAGDVRGVVHRANVEA
jgi:hypothetical protein